MATLLYPRLLFHLLSPTDKGKGGQEGRDRRKGRTKSKRDAGNGELRGELERGSKEARGVGRTWWGRQWAECMEDTYFYNVDCGGCRPLLTSLHDQPGLEDP